MSFLKYLYACCDSLAKKLGLNRPQWGTSQQWREWEASQKAIRPIRYWTWYYAQEAVMWAEIWLVDKPNRLHSWLYCALTGAHVMKSKSIKLGDWEEFDVKLLHCCFDEIVDFVEIECASMMEGKGWKAGFEYLKVTEDYETMALYNWWKHERPERIEPHELVEYDENFNEKPGSISCDDYERIEKDQWDEDTEMLIRLIRHRGRIWT